MILIGHSSPMKTRVSTGIVSWDGLHLDHINKFLSQAPHSYIGVAAQWKLPYRD